MKRMIFNLVGGSQCKTPIMDTDFDTLRDQLDNIAECGSISVDIELPATGKIVQRVLNPTNVLYVDIVEGIPS